MLLRHTFPASFDKSQGVHSLHQLPESATDLHEVRTPLEIQGDILASSVEESWIEEHAIACF